jgi:hypothetical protein
VRLLGPVVSAIAPLHHVSPNSVRRGGVADPSAISIRGGGVVLFVSEEFDDAELAMRYRLLKAVSAPHPVRHALEGLKRKEADVAFVASVPDSERERVVSDIRAAIKQRG